MSSAFTARIAARDLQPEIMDQPGLDARLHCAALASLGRINWWSRTDAVLWEPIRQLIASTMRPVRVLDVACGGGDVLRSLARRALRANLEIEWTGCDISEPAIDFARRESEKAGLPAICYLKHDVLADGLPEGFDVITSTLFLHHLEMDDAEALMRRMAAAAGRLVLIDDLVRTRSGYLLAWFGGRLLTRSHVVHADGPQSVRAALTLSELRAMAERAGLVGATIRPHWPQRMLLTWERGS